MYDDDGVESTDVTYSLDDLGEGRYRLTVTPDKTWINAEDRAFPVIVDPTVTTVYDTYLDYNNPDTAYGLSTNLLISSSCSVMMRIRTLPTIPENSIISSAYLSAYYYYYVSSGYVNIAVNAVTVPWNEITFTYNNFLALYDPYDDSIIDSSCGTISRLYAAEIITPNEPYKFDFDITKIFQTWYWNSPDSYSVLLTYNGGTNTSVIIKSWESGSPTRPLIEFNYTYEESNLPISSGNYFIRNAELENSYMQINDDSNQNHLEAFKLNTSDDQKWRVDYLYNGFYRIVSEVNGEAITLPSSLEENEPLETDTWNYGWDQQWEINLTSTGTITICSRIRYTFYIAAGDAWIFESIEEGRNVEQREERDDKKDEWYFYKDGCINYVELEGQQTSSWCWVTSARMFMKNYYSITLTQEQAVNHIFGDVIDTTGDKEQAIKAMNYYKSTISSVPMNVIEVSDEIYSEDILRQFIDDCHVLYITWGEYDADPLERKNGHAVVLLGYVWLGDSCRFIINDPWPMASGETYLISYQNLVSGITSQNDESDNNRVWDGCIVPVTSYSSTRLPYYFNQ